MPNEKLIRPAHCEYCRRPLFYSDDPAHEPEVRVEVEDERCARNAFYAHVKCWNTRYQKDSFPSWGLLFWLMGFAFAMLALVTCGRT